MSTANRYCASCGAANVPAANLCCACGLSLKITAPLPQDTANQHLLQQRYRLLAQLGKGGSSAVYKAEDTFFDDHPVAIKAVSLRGLKPQDAIEATDTFNREIQLLSSLKHPNLPHVYSNFSDAECWYLVMDFIDGTTLEKRLEIIPDGRLPPGEVLEFGLLLCSVLEYLHTHQPPIVFRDLKPANVMLTPDGRIALIDFGIARYFKPGQTKDTIPFGSPGYAAPEQYGKAQTTPRTDIYSLGVLLHQLLTGNDPSESPFRFAPLPLDGSPALADLDTLIRQMVEMDAGKRPASISIVKEELNRIADAWSTRYRDGMKAGGPYARPLPSAFWQSLLPPPEVAGIPLATGGTGQQMSLLQLSAPGAGGSSQSSSAYWSTPRPQKRYNGYATASFVFGLLTLLSGCFASTDLLAPQLSVSHFISLLIPVLAATLALICGHIGKHRANTIHGLGESQRIAVTGLTIGYLFGSIYLLSLLFLLCRFF